MGKKTSHAYGTLRRVMLIGVFLCFQTIPVIINGQNSKSKVDDDSQLASAAADVFMERYCKALDVGPILDEMGSSTTINGLPRIHFFEDFGIDPQLAKALNNKMLDQVYRSIMNAYFMGSLHNIFITDEKEILPKDVIAAFNKSGVGRQYMDWYLTDKSNGRPLIKSEPELTEYLRLNEEVTMLLRKHIPLDPFNSPVYLKEFSGTNKPVELASSDYGEDFGLKKGTAVYFVRRDFFNLFFVKEKNLMKLLFLGTGD